MNPTARHNARELALQALYQWQMTDTPLNELEAQFIAHQIRKKKLDLEYFKELIQKIPPQSHALDEAMIPFLDRSITDLDPIELAILRLAIYELKERLEIPYRVVINEALELTKRFGSVEGYKFVNGILDKVSRKSRTVEMHAQKKS